MKYINEEEYKKIMSLVEDEVQYYKIIKYFNINAVRLMTREQYIKAIEIFNKRSIK